MSYVFMLTSMYTHTFHIQPHDQKLNYGNQRTLRRARPEVVVTSGQMDFKLEVGRS